MLVSWFLFIFRMLLKKVLSFQSFLLVLQFVVKILLTLITEFLVQKWDFILRGLNFNGLGFYSYCIFFLLRYSYCILKETQKLKKLKKGGNNGISMIMASNLVWYILFHFLSWTKFKARDYYFTLSVVNFRDTTKCKVSLFLLFISVLLLLRFFLLYFISGMTFCLS